MIKEMFALYLTFASPVGDVELFVRELPNCDNAEEIAEEEYLKRNDSFSYVEDSILLQDLLENIIKIGENNKL